MFPGKQSPLLTGLLFSVYHRVGRQPPVVGVAGAPVLVRETDLATLQDRLFRREGGHILSLGNIFTFLI